MLQRCFPVRNDVAEMRLKLADTYLKLGEIGMETGITHTMLVLFNCVGSGAMYCTSRVNKINRNWSTLFTTLSVKHGRILKLVHLACDYH